MIIRNCLEQLKKDNLKSIAFPAIGSGNLNYPSNLVAEAIIEECVKFLKQNEDTEFEIYIIVYEKDHDLLFEV